ncbi:unnamed protein product [Durusdinium trenchii]|uniref:Uncharacterized protein n=1 Tax=Durusdinium trenchii TaxID=1381693 RepID=A0ABP0NLL8_9DINO
MTLSRRELRARKGRNGRPAWQRHMKVLLAELNQLKDEQQALKYCLMSTGVLTQGDLARLAPRRCRAPPSAERRESRAAALCRAPHVVRTLAQLVGSDALHFAAASRAASSACRSVMLMSEVSPGQGGQGLFGRLFSTASISRGASQASQGAPAQENETTPASSEEADVPRMRLSARLFSRLLSWKNSEEENSNVSDVMQLKEVLRGFGRAAGATAAFQLSESCRGCNEALRPILPLISQEAPYIYVSGGSCGLVVDSAERLNPRTGLWETLPSMCIPRRACATASTGGRFYVLGGVDVPRFVGSFDLPSWAYEATDRAFMREGALDHSTLKYVVEAVADTECRKVLEEIRARVSDKEWVDPHNGGTYSLESGNGDLLELSRLTGNKRYTDQMTFTFTPQGKTCAIHACSESQVFSIADFSTNYCNLRNLYCGSEEGCQFVRHDFVTEEKKIDPSFGAGTDKAACMGAAGTSIFASHWVTAPTDF